MDSLNFKSEQDIQLFNIEDKQDDGNFDLSHVAVNQDFYLNDESKALKVKELALELQIDERKLMWKIDFFVLAPFCLLYLIANFDRTHFGLLYLNGITSTLEITQLQYFAACAAFFSPYVFFQFFSNLILKSVRPHFWISISVLFYGAFVLASGFVKSYSGYIACEFFHGVFQSGCDSAVFYILAHYYERRESQKRISYFYSTQHIAMLINTVLCYGINLHMHDRYGLETWRWLLIIEGSITMGSAFILFFILPDFPEGMRFFTNNETLFIVKKLEVYFGKSGYNISFSWKEVGQTLRDPMVWLPGIAAMFLGIIPYDFTYIQSISFNFLGYSVEGAMEKAIYPWICGFLYIIFTGYMSDYFRIRSPFVIVGTIFTIYGLMVLRYIHSVSMKDPWKYSTDFFIACGAYSALPHFIGWATFNLCGHLRRSVATSLMISLSDLSGLYGLFILLNNNIKLTKATTVGYVWEFVSLVLVIAYVCLVYHENKKKRSREYKDNFNELSERKKILVGDKNPSYDYMY
ncbi:hypothetical protein DASC09_055800 [Saccharomycopsis crataegensis]|uniref:Major facilitator superfamily (MFS) profile domain-containing protein n=1 Tax=Saccharomycopsis crataegensis TaxID=43959 RepID=A0AAV5QUQ0_9ASCO|nr:hypothetical protein DASC09_055800 [Saccharomycopsis crataegensis]